MPKMINKIACAISVSLLLLNANAVAQQFNVTGKSVYQGRFRFIRVVG